jgi:hypothetical protein
VSDVNQLFQMLFEKKMLSFFSLTMLGLFISYVSAKFFRILWLKVKKVSSKVMLYYFAIKILPPIFKYAYDSKDGRIILANAFWINLLLFFVFRIFVILCVLILLVSDKVVLESYIVAVLLTFMMMMFLGLIRPMFTVVILANGEFLAPLVDAFNMAVRGMIPEVESKIRDSIEAETGNLITEDELKIIKKTALEIQKKLEIKI